MPCAKVSFVCSLMLFITILAILLRQVVTHQTKRKIAAMAHSPQAYCISCARQVVWNFM
jgi:hypothetical protein